MSTVQTKPHHRQFKGYSKNKPQSTEWNISESSGLFQSYTLPKKAIRKVSSNVASAGKVYKLTLDDIAEKALWINPNYDITLGNETLELKRNLSNIYEAIVNSQDILELYDDWDDEGAIGHNQSVYNRAIKILINYSNTLLNDYKTVITEPEISLGKDGSIDLEWRDSQHILLLNITNSQELTTHYYGEDIKGKTIIKGFLDSIDINEDLAFWMRKLS
ncbi:hypothetical protein WNY78_02185 [Psychroserpens sp. AS72]|uniref:hypothetical protein n=1 Tax=Psychroserpens sp. AS72 TaxID=3135775 RepID=UPI0031774DED